jgi:hypothetical protein
MDADGPSLAASCADRSQGDADLEHLINQTMQMMCAAKTRGCREYWAAQMRTLIGQRSPERIREMESARGLG